MTSRGPAFSLACTVAFINLVCNVQTGAAEAAASLNKQDWMERMRYEVRQQADENRVRMTGLLPDTPFIQLRNGADPDGRSQSVNGTRTNPRVVNLRRGQTAVLQCEVLGMPSPLAYWTKNGQPVTVSHAQSNNGDGQSGNVVEMITNNGKPTLEHAVTVAKLKFTCVTESQAGTYECNGDNGVEKVVAYTEVVVDDQAAAASDTNGCQMEETMVPPNIYMYTEMRLEYPGNDAQLMCRADGKPRPTIRWFDSSDNQIKNGENFTILSNGDLLVKRINFGIREPFRQFSCHAKNSAGKDVAMVDLLAISRSK